MPLVWINSACGVMGAILLFAFGGWSESLTFLLVAMAADYLTGIAASLKEGKGLSSSFGAWGLARKGLSLLVVLLAHRIDVLLNTEDVTMGAAIFFYIANELISVTENYGRLGLPLPERIRKMIAVLKEKDK
ncbi:holin [Paenibacillus sp. MY03]|jgi:toxin secretion/phage lysis holin|uniref:Holin n=1 Tax=Paenibacillus agaridevorans TaxID=171404 RepID=A0A2R5F0I0_9BACL|nr:MULTISPECIES: phage holin family protein [Paenibacillus]OUS77620.1 holin [Paenibacillus sp. MY03]GBG12297.1 holin [Paenibacillus agaridevorans]